MAFYRFGLEHEHADLDLSRVFDPVHWPPLWRALSEQVISDIDGGLLVDEFVVSLSQVYRALNGNATKVMATEAQPPSFLSTLKAPHPCFCWPVSRCVFGKEGVVQTFLHRAGRRLVGTAG